jgi:hypothetical protein
VLQSRQELRKTVTPSQAVSNSSRHILLIAGQRRAGGTAAAKTDTPRHDQHTHNRLVNHSTTRRTTTSCQARDSTCYQRKRPLMPKRKAYQISILRKRKPTTSLSCKRTEACTGVRLSARKISCSRSNKQTTQPLPCCLAPHPSTQALGHDEHIPGWLPATV